LGDVNAVGDSDQQFRCRNMKVTNMLTHFVGRLWPENGKAAISRHGVVSIATSELVGTAEASDRFDLKSKIFNFCLAVEMTRKVILQLPENIGEGSSYSQQVPQSGGPSGACTLDAPIYLTT
jgi:hypothetical protein